MPETKRSIISWVALAAALVIALPVFAGNLDKPIIEKSEGDLDTCALGEVTGLKADGDGFLSVRAGPATSYRKLDEVHNGDRVWVFQKSGDWLGVVYDIDQVDCSPIKEDRILERDGKKGWIHGKWIQIIAG